MSKLEDREEFIAIMQREYPEVDLLEWCQTILRHGASLHRLAETGCNRELTEKEERSDLRHQKAIEAACAEIGCTAVFSGDPRGAVVKIVVPSGKTNDWGQTGICVP